MVVTCDAGYSGSGSTICTTSGTFTNIPSETFEPGGKVQSSSHCDHRTCLKEGDCCCSYCSNSCWNFGGGNEATGKISTGTANQCGACGSDKGAKCYKFHPGYYLAGSISVPTCIAKSCTPAGSITNSDKAEAESITGTTGQSVAVTCDAGYSGSGSTTCSITGTFTNVPTCAAKPHIWQVTKVN